MYLAGRRANGPSRRIDCVPITAYLDVPVHVALRVSLLKHSQKWCYDLRSACQAERL
jgi:hypothetical protein